MRRTLSAAGHDAQAFACSQPWVAPCGSTRATHASHPVPGYSIVPFHDLAAAVLSNTARSRICTRRAWGNAMAPRIRKEVSVRHNVSTAIAR